MKRVEVQDQAHAPLGADVEAEPMHAVFDGTDSGTEILGNLGIGESQRHQFHDLFISGR